LSQDLKFIQLTIDEGAFRKTGNRLRNQLVRCMHTHNELAALNRILMFSMNKTGDSWCFLQVLAGKLVKTWNMLNERFLKAKPDGPRLVVYGSGAEFHRTKPTQFCAANE
jgi:hypothetical protein